MHSRVDTGSKRGLIAALAAQAVYVLSLWLCMAFLAKFSSEKEVGIFSICVAISGPIFLLLNFDARTAKTSDIEGLHDIREYLWFRFYCSLCSIFLVLIAAACVPDDSISAPLICFSLFKFFESLSDMASGAYYLHKKFSQLFSSIAIRGSVGACVFILAYMESEKLSVAFLMQALFAALFFLTYDLYQSQKCEFDVRLANYIAPIMKVSISREKFYELVKSLFPLGMAVLLVSLQAQTPKYVVYLIAGLEESGAFSLLLYCVTAASILFMPLENYLVRYFSELLIGKEINKLSRLTIKYFFLVLVVCLPILYLVNEFSATLIQFIYSESYARHKEAFLILAISIALRLFTSYLQSLLIATRRFSYQAYVQFFVLMAILLLSFVLIPSHGVLGAAWVVLLATLFRAFILSIFLKQYLGAR